jgi:two-component system secretion response regulator SsrB
MRIVIADDHNLMRAGFKNLLTALDHNIIAEAENFTDLERIMQDIEADLLVSDFDMPGGELLPVLERIRRQQPELKIIILTGLQYIAVFQQVLSSNANIQGLLTKAVNPEDLQQAIETVSRGEQYIQEEIRQLLEDSTIDLTKRQLQVLSLLVAGLSNSEVADKLYISIKTVDTHRMHLMKKLDAHNVVQLIDRARELGLVG